MVYRKPLNTMGLLGMLFGSSPKTKSDYDAAIARKQGELANAKLDVKRSTSSEGKYYHESRVRTLNNEIASLKSARAKAPKG